MAMKPIFKLLKKVHLLDKIASKLVFDPPKKSTYRLNRHNHVIVDKYGDLNEEASNMKYNVKWVYTENKLFVLFLYPKTLSSISECDRVVLYSHGTSVDVGNSLNTAFKMTKIIDEETTGLVLWDFPGYGLSKGKPSEKSMLDGIVEVYYTITDQFGVNGNSIIATGFSLGTLPTVYLGTKFLVCPLMAVILISPLASAYLAVKGKKYKEAKDPVGVFSNLETLNHGICPWPVFVAHGTNDAVVHMEDCALLVKSLERFPSQQELDTCIDVMVSSDNCINDNQSTIPESEEVWKSRVSYCPIVGAGHNSIIRDSCFIGSTHQFIRAL